MRKVIFIILTILLPIICIGQSDSLESTIDTNITQNNNEDSIPSIKYIIVNGDTVGISMNLTIEQAQKIDNDYELYKLLEDLSIQYKTSDSIFIRVIDEQGEQIFMQQVQIDELKGLNKDKDDQIYNLNVRVNEYKDKVENLEKESSNKDLIIVEKDKQLKKNKLQKLIGGIGGGSVIVGLIIIIIII